MKIIYQSSKGDGNNKTKWKETQNLKWLWKSFNGAMNGFVPFFFPFGFNQEATRPHVYVGAEKKARWS